MVSSSLGTSWGTVPKLFGTTAPGCQILEDAGEVLLEAPVHLQVLSLKGTDGGPPLKRARLPLEEFQVPYWTGIRQEDM